MPPIHRWDYVASLDDVARYHQDRRPAEASPEPVGDSEGVDRDKALGDALSYATGEFVGPSAAAFEAAREALEAIARYQPENARDLIDFMLSLHTAYTGGAAEIDALAARTPRTFTMADGTVIPVDGLIDFMREQAECMGAIGAELEGAYAALYGAHSAEIKHLDRGHPFWDVASNGGGEGRHESPLVAGAAGGAALAGAPESYTPSATRPRPPASYVTPDGHEVVPGAAIAPPIAQHPDIPGAEIRGTNLGSAGVQGHQIPGAGSGADAPPPGGPPRGGGTSPWEEMGHGENEGRGALSPELIRSVRGELAKLERDLRSGELLGVSAECLVGFEIDFTLTETSAQNIDEASDERLQERFGHSWEQLVANRERLESTRAQIREEISQLVPRNEQQARTQQTWLNQVPDLTVSELALYQVYRRLSTPTLDDDSTIVEFPSADNSPHASIEFRFGQNIYQQGWYDRPGGPEIRTQAASPSVALERHRNTVDTIQEVADEYGITFRYQADHTNFSVWSRDPESGQFIPMHSLQERQEVVRNGVGGILEALADTAGAVVLPDRLPETSDTEPLTAGHLRDADLRVLPDRVEYRRPIGADGSPELVVLAHVAGFVYGQQHPEEVAQNTSVEQRPLFVTDEGFDKQEDLHFLRAIQNSGIDTSDGHLIISDDYAASRGEVIIQSMVAHEADSSANMTPHERTDLVRRIVATVSVDSDGALHLDQARLDDVLQSSVATERFAGAARVVDRMSTVRYAGEVDTVQGAVEFHTPVPTTLHNDLNSFANSAPLRSVVDPGVLDSVRAARASAFTHEAAVVNHINFEVLFDPSDFGLNPHEQAITWATRINVMIAADPTLDRVETVRLLDEGLERDITNYQEYLSQGPPDEQLSTLLEARERLRGMLQ